MRRIFGLCAISGLAGYEASCAPRDAFQLVQWDYHVNPVALAEESTESDDYEPPHRGTPESKARDLKVLQDILRRMQIQLVFNNSEIHGKIASNESFNLTGMPLPDIDEIVDAVRSDAFMGNMSQLLRRTDTAVRELRKAGISVIDDFVFWSQTAKEEEMPKLAIWVFNNLTNLSRAFQDTMMQEAIATLPSMPPNMADTVKTNVGLAMEVFEQDLLPQNVTQDESCDLAEEKLVNSSAALAEVVKAGLRLNQMQAMKGQLYSFIQTAQPAVAGRIIYLVDHFIENMMTINNESMTLLQATTGRLTPVLQAKLACTFSFSACAGLRTGLLAALVSLAALLLQH